MNIFGCFHSFAELWVGVQIWTCQKCGSLGVLLFNVLISTFSFLFFSSFIVYFLSRNFIILIDLFHVLYFVGGSYSNLEFVSYWLIHFCSGWIVLHKIRQSLLSTRDTGEIGKAEWECAVTNICSLFI